jgi:SOS response regulatory protein OraA/RecX
MLKWFCGEDALDHALELIAQRDCTIQDLEEKLEATHLELVAAKKESLELAQVAATVSVC